MQRVLKFGRRRWWLAVLMSAVLLWLIWQLNGPAVGTITKGQAQLRTGTKSAQSSHALTSQYIRLEIGSDYQPANLASKTDLESFKFHGKGQPYATLAIIVSQPPFGPQESPALLYRQQHPELYSQETRQVNGHALTIFTTKSGSYEKSAFSISGPLVASVALTSYQGSPAALDEEFAGLVASFGWQ